VPSTEIVPVPHAAPDTDPCTDRHSGRRTADVPLTVLVDGARAGCPGAWRELVDRFDAGLHAMARSYGMDAASLDDVVQQTWLAAVTQLPALREPAALPGWLRTILHRECLRALNRTSREEPVVPHELGELVGGTDRALRLAAPRPPEEQVLHNDRIAALHAAVAQLPRRERELMTLLSDAREPSYTEIARRLDLPIGSIGPTRARCLAKLRPLLAG
jgi:RNA polymerase sigma factor (sigma-70 family)